jgi:glucosamine-6-phosphate deaminase
MNIVINKDYETMSKKAADFIAKYIEKKPDTLLCIAGGETPMGIFRYLVKYSNEKKIDYRFQ